MWKTIRYNDGINSRSTDLYQKQQVCFFFFSIHVWQSRWWLIGCNLFYAVSLTDIAQSSSAWSCMLLSLYLSTPSTQLSAGRLCSDVSCLHKAHIPYIKYDLESICSHILYWILLHCLSLNYPTLKKKLKQVVQIDLKWVLFAYVCHTRVKFQTIYLKIASFVFQPLVGLQQRLFFLGELCEKSKEMRMTWKERFLDTYFLFRNKIRLKWRLCWSNFEIHGGTIELQKACDFQLTFGVQPMYGLH